MGLFATTRPIAAAAMRRRADHRSDRSIATRQGYDGSARRISGVLKHDVYISGQRVTRLKPPASLGAWENSQERAWWVSTEQGLVEHGDYELRTGIEGWFDEPTSVEVIAPTSVVPPRWKQMIAIFFVFYPLSLAANYGLAPLLGAWPIWARALASVILISPVMTYLALPFITRALRPWLQRPRRSR
jgi:antibiotic biosynthesis monooxygenase (ABM) superfamily enzyme